MDSNRYNTYRLSVVLSFVFLFAMPSGVQSQTITTVAGNGSAGYSGDGGPATSASIYWPWTIAADGAGGFYCGGDWWWSTTSSYARIRRVNAAGIINTYAGTGTSGFSGDGGPATAATLYGGGVASDAAGNLYILDWGNYRIRKVTASTGIITTIAGNGSTGYTGDGGPATAAALGFSSSWWWGSGIACDPSGNVYIYVWNYYKVRKIDASTGIITTICGTGSMGFSGDGGAATAAQLGYCYGLAADGSGNVFIADYTYERIRMINSSGIINTIAGNGSGGYTGDGGPATAAQLGGPTAVAVDGAGNITLNSYYYHRIRKINTSGIISAIAGTGTAGFSGDGGPATAANLYYPIGLCVDGPGNVYISDYDNLRIRKINNYNRPPYFTLGLSANLTVCQNSIGDSVNSLLPVMDSDFYQPEIWSLLSAPSHGSATIAWTTTSTGLVMTPHGCSYTPTTGYSGPDTFKVAVNDGYVADTITIYVTVNPLPASITGTTVLCSAAYTTLYSSTSGGTWSSGAGTIAAAGGSVGVVTGVSAGVATITYTLPTGCIRTVTVNVFAYAGQSITTIAGTGAAGYSGDGGAAISAQLNQPWGVVTDAAGNKYFADYSNNCVRKVNISGVISTVAGGGSSGLGDGGAATAAQLNHPIGVALDASGNLYIGDKDNNRIRKVNTSGIISTFAGNGTAGYGGDGSAATLAQINQPSGVTVDGSGNVYIADYSNSRIRKVGTSGIISTIAGTGVTGFSGDGGSAAIAQISTPFGVYADGNGNILIADGYNNRVRKINSSGIISTIAGGGSSGLGDGGPATAAQINVAVDVTADPLGNIYISDGNNSRVRKVNTSGIISTVAGTGTAGYSGDACAATAGMINHPGGVSLDGSGNLYIGDWGNNRVRRIVYNRAPQFTGGHSQTSSMCQSSTDTINSLLAIMDIDVNQGETWSTVTGPVHGTLVASYTATSTGGIVTPAGLYYTPATGYTGNDSFKVLVTDCSGGTDTTWIHIVVTPPPSSITGSPTVCAGFSTLFVDLVGTGTWSSSNTSVATVGSAGMVTGVSVGSATITFAPGASCFVTKGITVNPSPAAITGTHSICLGTTYTFTDATGGGSWSSSDVSRVTAGASTGVVNGVTAGIATISYTQGGCPALFPVTVNNLPFPISGVSEICMSTATGYIDAGGGSWSSSTPAVGSVDATGYIRGLSVGSTTITYTLPTGCYVTKDLSVDPLPAPIIGPDYVCVGQHNTQTDATPGGFFSIFSVGFTASMDSVYGVDTGLSAGTATIYYSAGLLGCAVSKTITVTAAPAPITGTLSVCVGLTTLLSDPAGGGTWSSSLPAIATIGTSSGLVSGISGGPGGSATDTITYSTGSGCSTTAVVTVNANPAAITGTAIVCNGLTTPLFCATAGGTWSSGTATVATVGGATGVVYGVAPGTSVITYTTSSGCTTTRTVTVNSSPAPITGTLHACPATTSLLSDAIGGGAWSSSTPSVAGINSASGLVTGVTPGTATITYSIGAGCSTTTIFTVNSFPAAISGPLTVCQGSTATLSDATPGGSWSATGTAASIGAGSGIVTGSASGTSGIIYTVLSTGCTASATVTVNALPANISGPATVCMGATATYTDATPGGAWSSSSPSVAGIGSASGILAGLLPGATTLSYTLGTGCQKTKAVTVNALPPAIAGPSAVCQGSDITLTDPAPGGTWSTASTTATVNPSGTVTGVTSGVALISYTSGGTGCSATKTVTVNPLPMAITGPAALCVGATITEASTPGGAWISVTPSVATIGSSSGIITGIMTGTTDITYTLPTGCLANTTVTVSTSPTAILGPSTVCVGATTLLTDAVGGGVWTSSNPATGSIGSLSGMVTGVTPGATLITYSLGSSGCTVNRIMTVTASPAAILGGSSLCIGGSTPLSDATPGGAWSSSAGTIASVTGTGVAGGVAAGTATVSYTLGGCSATLDVTVNPTPTAITGPTAVCLGATVSEADAVSGGVWSATSPVLSIGSASGIVTGLSSGTGLISYSIGACRVTRTITVSGAPAISGPLGICVGNTGTLTAAGGGTWGSSLTGVATIGPSTGIMLGVAPGTTTITYTLGTGCSATAMVTVNTAPSAIGGVLHTCVGQTTTLSNTAGGGIWISGNTAIATAGSSSGVITGTGPGTVTITYSLGSGCTATAVVTVQASPAAITGPAQVCEGQTITLHDATTGGVWSSAAGATVSAGGIVTGVTAGTAAISYTAGSGCAATTTITVNQAASPIAGPLNVCVGLSIALSDAVTGGTWSSGSTSVATVTGSAGIVTGGAPGTSVITYTLPTGCAATATVTVNSAPVAITGSMQVCIGSATLLSDATPGGVWSSASGSIATVTAGGTVIGWSPGTAVISYSVGGCPALATVTVNSLPGTISGPASVCVGANITLTDIPGGGTWSSSNTVLATAGSATGIITGMAPGTVTISYSLGAGCTVSTPIAVNPAPSGITGSSNICIGATTTLADATPGGTWSSAGTAIATIGSTTGIVTGVTGGTAMISYTAPSGCAATFGLVVVTVPAITGLNNICAWGDTLLIHDANPAGSFSSTLVTIVNLGGGAGRLTGYASGTATITYTLAGIGCATITSITVNPLPGRIAGIPQLCNGMTTLLSDTTTGGVWTSANPSVATVGSATGVVSSHTPGSTLVTYLLPTGCKADTLVTVSATPSPIGGASQVCAGATITLTDTSGGGVWASSNTLVAGAGAGTGVITGVTAGTATITYTVAMSCRVTTSITVNPLPGTYIVTGGGNYCSGGAGMPVGLSGSHTGVTYQLYNGTTATGTPITGTGTSVDFGMQTAGGTYTVMATDAVTGCTRAMTGSTAIVIMPTVVPAVTVAASTGDTVCTGTSVNFTALPVNGGTAPAYNWKLNGFAAGTGPGYTHIPANGDVVSVMLHSSQACAIPDSAAGQVTMTVLDVLAPTVTITAHPGTTIAAGDADTLVATVTNGGTSPAYQWVVNGSVVAGATTNTLISSSFANGDSVSCSITGSGPCGNQTTSSYVIITVNGGVGVKTITGAGAVQVVPNPNKGEFTIRGAMGSLTDEEVHLAITDVLGQVIYSETVMKHNGTLNHSVVLSKAPANGMYLLSLRSESETKVFCIVIEQ